MKTENGYFDMHTHILPNVDDGAKDMDESLKMIQCAYQEGVRAIVATPHFVPGNVGYDVMHIPDTANCLAEEIKKQYPDMRLYYGNEFYYREGAERYLKDRAVLTIADSDYLLVEFNILRDKKKINEAVRRMTQLGYRPILAHTERYQNLWKELDEIESLIRLGALIQINADSVTGSRFHPECRACSLLIKEDMVHFIGSDCHDPIRRKPQMRKAAEILKKKMGQEKAWAVLSGNMERVIQNEYLKI